MKKFIALFLAPAAVIEAWMKTDPDQRKEAEQTMRAAWDQWMADHVAMILETWAGGKTKRVSAGGVGDVRNDVMLYSIIEAESHDAAAQSFAHHPHLQIPQSSIEIMEIRSMSGG